MTSAKIGDAAPAGERKRTTQVVKRRSNMEAVYGGWVWSRERLVALFLGLAVIALLAGGAGGYLIRGATTLVVTHTITKVVPSDYYFGVLRTTAGFIPGL
jgi:hypothetical protein